MRAEVVQGVRRALVKAGAFGATRRELGRTVGVCPSTVTVALKRLEVECCGRRHGAYESGARQKVWRLVEGSP